MKYFFLSLALLCVPEKLFSMQAQALPIYRETAGLLKLYETDISKLLKQIDMPLENIAQDESLFFPILEILGQYPTFAPDLIPEDFQRLNNIRQNLFAHYLDRSAPKDYSSIDILGKKISAFLKSPLIYEPYLWQVLEDYIQKYCFRGSSRMPAEQHCIFNNHIVDISQFYSMANANRFVQNMVPSVNFYATQDCIGNSLRANAGYLNYLTRRVIPNQDQSTSTADLLSPESAPPAQSIELEIKVEAEIEDAAKNSPTKLTKKQRAAQKKLREPKSIKIESDLQEEKLVEKPVEKIIEEPKSREIIKLEYLEQEKNNITNYDRFFSYLKECYESDSTKEKTEKILQELQSNTDNMIVQLYLAKFWINCKKDPNMFIWLFDDAIANGTAYDFIEKILETNIYADLIRLINNSDPEEINKYSVNITNYINITILLPIAVSNVVCDMVEQVTKTSMLTYSQEKAWDIKLTQESKKKWISCNVKLLQALSQKTVSRDIKILLIDICTCFGYGLLFDNFIIKPEELIKLVKEAFVDVSDYHMLLDRLLEKDNKTAKKVALECAMFCAEFFNDFACMNLIYGVMSMDTTEDSKEKSEKLEYWARQIIKRDPTQEPMKANLAMLLYNKTENDPQEIIDLLQNNKCPMARLFYNIIYCREHFNLLVKLDPEELTTLLEINITNQEITPVKALLRSFMLLFQSEFTEIDRCAYIAAKQYNSHESELSLEEKEDLKKIIYRHTAFNKRNSWPERFSRIYNAIEKTNPDINLYEYLEKIDIESSRLIGDMINMVRTYDIELHATDTNTEYQQDSHGNTILHHLAFGKDYDIILFLIKQHPRLISIKNKLLDSAILLLNRDDENKMIEIIRACREIDPDIINAKNINGTALIHMAAKYNLLNVFKYLVEECKVSIDTMDNENRNCMLFLLENEAVDIMNYILESHLDLIDIPVMIYMSCVHNKPKIFKILLDNIKNDQEDGSLALNCFPYAIKNGFIDIAKMLIDSGKKFIKSGYKPSLLFRELIEIAQAEKKKEENSDKESFKKFRSTIKSLKSYLEALETEENKIAAAQPKQKTRNSKKK